MKRLLPSEPEISRAGRWLLAPAAILAGGLIALGCGSDGGTTTVVETTPGAGTAQSGSGEGASEEAAAAAKAITIDMGEYYYRPKDATANAGQVTISAKNVGKLPHELVLARTNVAPSALPTLPDGSVDEETAGEGGQGPR